MDYLKGKTVLVFGASRGIGLATATKMAELGAKVVLASRSDSAITSASHSINADGGTSFAVQCDVSSYVSVSNCVKYCVEKTGSIDIVVNNAGVIEPISHLVDSDPELWDRAVNINFKGVYHSMRASIPEMLKQGGGIVINLSSGAANSALEGWSHYCSTKSAVKKLTEVAHKELADKNIRVVGL